MILKISVFFLDLIELTFRDLKNSQKMTEFNGHNGYNIWLILSSDNHIYSASSDRTLKVWDKRMIGKCVFNLEGNF